MSESAKRLKALLNAIDAKTGHKHLDLRSAVQVLCNGYGAQTGAVVDIGGADAESMLKCGSRVRALLDAANAKTGQNDPTLTAAVQRLCDGYRASAPLYSFAALADTHIQYATGADDLRRALPYLEDKVDFICICGDLVWCAEDSYMAEYRAITSDTTLTTKPIYECAGNHESYPANATTGTVDKTEWEATTGWANHTDCVGDSMYYCFTHGDDVFIMLSLVTDSPVTFADGALDWLQNVLETNHRKRCFVFQHIHDPADASADPSGKYSPILDQSADGQRFLQLMRRYPNAVWFHGHTHLSITTTHNDYKPVSTKLGYKSVHVPCLQGPRYYDAEADALMTYYYDANGNKVQGGSHAEGWIVDVYADKIVLRGIDFAKLNYNADWTYYYTVEPMPGCIFVLDTTRMEDST